MSALESLGPFFLLFLSFLLLLDSEDTGEGIERYRDDWMSGFWMSTVAMWKPPGLPDTFSFGTGGSALSVDGGGRCFLSWRLFLWLIFSSTAFRKVSASS